MAEETTSQTTEAAATEQAATETQTPTQEPASIKDTIEAQGKAEGESVEFESLFDSEEVSEAELRGEEETETKDSQESEDSQSETKKEDTASSPSKDEKKSDEEVEGSDKKAAAKADEAKDEQGKPPKGFVPIQALHQERGQRQILTQEVQDLRSELEALKSGKTVIQETEGAEQSPEETFEVLSEEAFEELLEEDPVEAMKYDRKERAHKAKLAEQAKAAQAETDIINQSLGMMATSVPGLYDKDSDVNQKLSDFAMEKGFADFDGLALVTDPRTRIVPANGGRPQLLGETAANLVIMLNTLFQEMATLGDNKVDAEALEKAAEEKVRDKVTKDVLAKLKQPAEAEHKSLGDIPGDAGEDIAGLGGPMSEADFAKLSEAEQRRYLGG